MSKKVISVKAAVRCRPMIDKEIQEGSQTCVRLDDMSPSVIVGKDKGFTYDYTFGQNSVQSDVYELCVEPLVGRIFKGYNATVLAYGQTSSGKTHTMGGGYAESLSQDENEMGIIPRVLRDIFNRATERHQIKVTYLEIHKEEIVDLLRPSDKREPLPIREGCQGVIQIPGLQEVAVTDTDAAMVQLQQGSQGRSTGATAMNVTSSRSHAIFTVYIEQLPIADQNDDTWTCKFHLVDLAGSERVKKTQAEGDRFKEGVKINKGLLSLGNVISALGDDAQKKGHIPYRDSKLTRILQDSLGGNSHTVMIACVSPADSNYDETLNTLRYADRARKIKNTPIVNRDPNLAEITRLRELVDSLRLKLLSEQGETTTSVSVSVRHPDVDHQLVTKLQQLEEQIEGLKNSLHESYDQNAQMCERNIKLELENERLQSILSHEGVNLDILTQRCGEEASPELTEEIAKIQSLTTAIKSLKNQGTQVLQTNLTKDEEGPIQHYDSEDSHFVCNAHLERQGNMQRELAELNKLLSSKEALATQMTANENQIQEIRTQYEETMKTLQTQVNDLTAEKSSLIDALSSARNNPSVTVVSENRRKRLKELEAKLSELKHKMTEQDKLLKMKTRSDDQVQSLNRDIQQMKQQRVKLMKQMKADADNYRKWKVTKEKEVARLVQKDRKREFEMSKLKNANQKQKCILKRKVEEAVAANKRLKEAMTKKKIVSDARDQKFQKYDNNAVGSRVRDWCNNEFDMRVGIGEAKFHLNSLLNDRRELTQQLKNVVEQMESNEPPRKRVSFGDSRKSLDSDGGEGALTKRKAELQHDIDLRTSQIQDLQQKIADAEQDIKGSSLCGNLIRTIAEAKCAMKWLMQEAVSHKVQTSLASSATDITPTQNYEDILSEKHNALECLKRQHDTELTQLRQQHEETVNTLLTIKEQAPPVTHSTPINSHMDTQQLIDNQNAMLAQKEEEITKLKQKLHAGPRSSMDFFSPRRSLMPPLTPKSRKFRKSKCTVIAEEDSSSGSSSDTDPDWQESPLYNPKNMKRKMPGSCSCKGICSTNCCGCKRNQRPCEDTCKCTSKSCKNRNAEINSTTDEDPKMDTTYTI